MIFATRIRRLREEAGLSQTELARRVGISRQALTLIEQGKAIPRVDTALRLARVLQVDVEALFSEEQSAPSSLLPGEWVIAGRRVSTPLSSEGLVPDVLPVPDEWRTPDTVWRRHSLASQDLVLAGCDPFASWLKARLEEEYPDIRVVLRGLGSSAALRRLRDGTADVAGLHIGDVDAHRRYAASVLAERSFILVDWLGWESGLAFSGGHRSWSDVHTIVARESGAAARHLLETELRAAGFEPQRALQDQPVARGHVEVAELLAHSTRAAGVTLAPIAQLYGLPFRPLRYERYQLCLLREQLATPAVQALLAVLSRTDWRPLRLLGCDTTNLGAVYEG